MADRRRVLLDENVPRQLRARLAGLSADLAVTSVNDPALSWKGIRNGDLLARMTGRFDVLVTADRSLRSQQKLDGRPFAVVVLPTNDRAELLALAPAIARAVGLASPGQALTVERNGTIRRLA